VVSYSNRSTSIATKRSICFLSDVYLSEKQTGKQDSWWLPTWLVLSLALRSSPPWSTMPRLAVHAGRPDEG
jgi:hypothetical protein